MVIPLEEFVEQALMVAGLAPWMLSCASRIVAVYVNTAGAVSTGFRSYFQVII
jgi:hypothetical protein